MKRLIALLSLSTICCSSAFAQLGAANIGGSGSFGNITDVGRLRGTRSLGATPAGPAGSPSEGTSANRVIASSARGEFSGRRTDTSVRGLGTRTLGDRSRSSLIMYFGRSPSAMVFARPDYDGRGINFRSRVPAFTNQSTRDILQPQKELPLLRSFHHRAVLPREGGSIRDELTNTSLRNSERLPEGVTYDSGVGESHATVLARSIEAKYQRYVTDGWELLASKELAANEYMRARILFENAMTIEPEKIEARIGKMLCSLAGSQFATAGADLNAVLKRDTPIFSVDVRSTEVFIDPATTREILRNLARLSQQEPDTPFLAALHAYMLWFDGQDTAAVTAARRLRDNFRTSPYAKLAEQIIKQPAKSDSIHESAAING